MRYGMTPGELARYLKGEEGIDVDLTVVPLAGWTRTRYYDEIGLPWTPPSPNMPDLESALHYPGVCLCESTNLSVGRGTPRAFQQLGAPWLDNVELVRRLAAYSLVGVRFEPVTFTPAQPGDGKFGDQLVRGVRFITTDRTTYDPTHAALAALREIQRLHADQLTWNQTRFDQRAGSARVREQIFTDASLAEITHGWETQLAAFKRQSAPYLLYP
jgi:uncharacterized protein YbbC (DUF1343 family)